MATLQIPEYERIWVDALNRGDISAADEAFAPNAIIHITGSPVPDLDLAGFKLMLAGIRAAFPDLHFTIEDQIASGDKVATRWSAEGSHTGPLGDIAATGKPVRIWGLIYDRVENGRVVERWEQWDQIGLMQQLGLA